MFKIPKLSAPLTKFIRTLEGQLIVGANVALVVVPIVTNSLSATAAARDGVILNGVTVFSRSILKGIAALGLAGAPPPAQLLSGAHEAAVEKDAGVLAGQVAGDVSKGASAAQIGAQVLADVTPEVSDEEEMATTPPPDPEAQPTAVAPAAPPAPAPAPAAPAAGA